MMDLLHITFAFCLLALALNPRYGALLSTQEARA